jgi:hypothetical protein
MGERNTEAGLFKCLNKSVVEIPDIIGTFSVRVEAHSLDEPCPQSLRQKGGQPKFVARISVKILSSQSGDYGN